MPRGSKPGERRGGRKKGTPNKIGADIRALAQVHTVDALQTLIVIAREGQSESARVAAANSLLDRAFGKPRQEIEHSGSIGRRADELSDAELLHIAGGGGARVAETARRAKEPDQLH